MFPVSLNVACAVVTTYVRTYVWACTYTVVPCSCAYGIAAAVPSLLFLTYIRTYLHMYVCGYQHDINCTVANRNRLTLVLRLIILYLN